MPTSTEEPSVKSDIPQGSLQEVKILKLKLQLPKCIASKKQQFVEVESTLDDTLSHLKETLALIPSTESLTNYNAFYNDISLFENFSDFSTFEEILPELGISSEVDNLCFRLAEKPYNLTEIYNHLLKFRQVIGLHFLDKSTFDFGVHGGASKFNDLDLTDPKAQSPEDSTGSDKTKNDQKSEENEKTEQGQKNQEPKIDLSPEEKSTITSIVNSLLTDHETTCKYNQLCKFDNNPLKNFKLPIKSWGLSQWSPVPPQQRVKGDLLYLSLTTLENDTFQITCNHAGFFINKSSTSKFNPVMKTDKVNAKQFLLFNLVKQISPSFEKILGLNLSNLHLKFKNPESYLIPSNSVPNYPWIVELDNKDDDEQLHNSDLSQNLIFTLDNGPDGANLIKDWNEEFQSIKELPKQSINERILRDKLLFKLICDFNKTATSTAIHIVNGDIMAMNVSEDPYQLTYLRNGIFYSFSIDATGCFEMSGKDEAARYTSGKDLATIKLLNKFESNDIHNLLTCIVDYMGKRIICQAPIPGIFQELKNETDLDVEKVIYGLTSDNSEIIYNENFNNSLKGLTEKFHLKPHSVELELPESHIKCNDKLSASKDIKGINGTDGRKYIIDLFRTTPLDIEFLEQNFDASNTLSYPHKEALIRHEAVDEWWKRRIAALFKQETEKMENKTQQGDKSNEDSEKPQILVNGDEVSVNPDAFTGINESHEDRKEVREVSKFILTLIDEFLEETSSQLAPFDGTHLTAVLHRFGINLRYLGLIANQCLVKKLAEEEKTATKIEKNQKLTEQRKEKKEDEKEQEGEKTEEQKEKDAAKSSGTFEPIVANYMATYSVVVQEMIARGTKHVLRKLSRDLPMPLMSTFISHFFNCLFGTDINKNPICLIDEDLKMMYSFKDLEFTKLNSQDVLNLITNEVFIRFRFNLPKDWNKSLVKPLQLFREISIKFGIQWKCQNFGFTKEEFERMVNLEGRGNDTNDNGKKKKGSKLNKSNSVITKTSPNRQTIFIPDDILAFVPIIKDSTYKSSILEEILQTAQVELNQDQGNGLLLFNELLSFYEQIFGRVHSETASYYGFLSQLYFDLNLLPESCKMSRIACILSERVYGFDCHKTITAYINSAFFELSNKDLNNSMKLYEHAIELWNLAFGSNHPSLITTYANLGDALTDDANLFDLSNKFFEKSVALSTELIGEMSEVTGLIKYRYGTNLIKGNKFKSSQTQFDEAYKIFEKVLGPKDHFTEKSLNFATNLNTYLQYQKHEAKKPTVPTAKNNNTNGKSKAKKGKKSGAPKVDETIASQSVDDILAFIEGNNSKKKAKQNQK